MGLLGRLVVVRDPNIRYLALEYLARLSVIPGVLAQLKQLQDIIISQLEDAADSSLKRRALDLLFILCDETNVTTIVKARHLVLAGLRQLLLLLLAYWTGALSQSLRAAASDG